VIQGQDTTGLLSTFNTGVKQAWSDEK